MYIHIHHQYYMSDVRSSRMLGSTILEQKAGMLAKSKQTLLNTRNCDQNTIGAIKLPRIEAQSIHIAI